MTKFKDKTSIQVVLSTLRKKSAPLIKTLEVSSVATNEDFDSVSTKLKTLKALGKEVAGLKAGFVEPAKEIIAHANNMFLPIEQELAKIEDLVKGKLIDFKQEQDRKAMKVLKDFEDGKIKKVSTVVAKQDNLRVESSSAKLRKLARAKCIDEKLTPREYLIPDERAILDAMKSGKKVKGWEIDLVDSIAI